MNNVLRFFDRVIRVSIFLISACVPLKRKWIVFSSYPDFSDNAWILYKYIKFNRNDLRLYWVVKDAERPIDVESSEIVRLTCKSYFKYYWIMYNAGYIFATHGLYTGKLKRNQQINVYLNHGGSAIKAGKGFNITNSDAKPPFDFALCRGKNSVIPVAKFFKCNPKYILPLGMARDDIFIKNIGSSKDNPFYDGHSKKLIIWMPTFRKSIQDDLSERDSATETGLPLMNKLIDINSLNSFLNKYDIQLVIKIHPLQEHNPIFNNKFSNVTFISNNDLKNINKQTYEIIGYSDALITDYSSVYFDYLITNKPIGFILDDIGKYNKDRGFVYDDPREIMAGHHIYNLNQLKMFLIDIVNGYDLYASNRNLMKERFIGVMPNSTSQHIVDFFNL